MLKKNHTFDKYQESTIDLELGIPSNKIIRFIE